MEKAIMWHTFKTSQNGDGSEAAAGNDELYLASLVGDHEAGNIRKQLWLRIPKGITGPLYTLVPLLYSMPIHVQKL
jgi:hypothetical protein